MCHDAAVFPGRPEFSGTGVQLRCFLESLRVHTDQRVLSLRVVRLIGQVGTDVFTTSRSVSFHLTQRGHL